MIDPGFVAAKKVTEVTGAFVIRASCSDFFPIDPSPMSRYIDNLDEKLPEVGSEVSSNQQNLIKRASASLKSQEWLNFQMSHQYKLAILSATK